MNFPENLTSHQGPLKWWKRSQIFSGAMLVFGCVFSASVFFSTYPFFAWCLGAIRFGRCMGECHARHLDKCNRTRPTARSERPVVFSFFFDGPAWGTSWVAGWLFPIGGLGSGNPPTNCPEDFRLRNQSNLSRWRCMRKTQPKYYDFAQFYICFIFKPLKMGKLNPFWLCLKRVGWFNQRLVPPWFQ